MQTTGVFTIHQYDIEFKNYNEPIYLFPFGDVHRSSNNCNEKKWLEFLEWAKAKPRAYFLGMGDYDDLVSASERIILSNSSLHEDTKDTIQGLYEINTNRFQKEIEFMGKRLIGLIEGNHYGLFESGFTTTQYLAQLMKTKYLGVSSFIRLRFYQKHRERVKANIDIWAHHGKGAARLVGGSLNRVENMVEAANADIYLMGHDHKKSCAYVSTMELKSGSGSIKLRNKKKLIGRTGSFLKGYIPEKKSYIADGAMNPTDLGVLKIELTPKRVSKELPRGNSKKRVREDAFYVDIHTSI
jgi:hypothetical protein